MLQKYSFGKGLWKGVLSFILFAIPVVIGQFPEFFNLTIGSALVILANYIKFEFNSIK